MIPDALLDDAEALPATCRANGITLATAESRIGGLIVATHHDRRFLGRGAVSEEVARAMTEGTLARSRTAIAVSVIGMVGPGGGGGEKPIGLVCFGLTKKDTPVTSERHVLPGDLAGVRAATVAHAFSMIRACI